MKGNIKIYKDSIKQNIDDIRFILEELEMEKQPPVSLYEKILDQTAKQVVSKWATGKKYCRTHFVQKAFGRWYPSQYIQASLCLDGMVNILDDLLDESLEKKVKTQYVIEFLRIFSIYNSEYKSC